MVNFYFLDAKLVIIFRLYYELYNFTVVFYFDTNYTNLIQFKPLRE